MAKIVQLENNVASDTLEEKIQAQNFIKNEEDAEEYERYIPVEQSIIGSLLEVREMIAGRMPKISWDDFAAELRAEVAEIEAGEQKNNAFKKRLNDKTLQG